MVKKSGRGSHRRIGWLWSLALLVAVARGDESPVLTGVIAASNGGKAFAVIEMADGRQRLVSVGDLLGEATVAAVHAETRSVSLAYPDGVRVLTLTGTAFPEEYVEPFRADDYQEQASSTMLGADDVRELLDLAGQAQALGEDTATARLHRLLSLPAGASIDGYADQPVATTTELLVLLTPLLAGLLEEGGYLGVLSVADADGPRRVYLSVEPGAPPR